MKYEEFRLKYPCNILEAFNIPIKSKWLCKHNRHNWIMKQEYIVEVEKIEQTNDIFGKLLSQKITYKHEVELYMKCEVCGKKIKLD